MISEQQLERFFGFLSNRDATTTGSTAIFNSGALSYRGKTAWASAYQPPTTLMVWAGDRYWVMYGVERMLLPTWLKPILESMIPLFKLETGWDSYQGRPIDRHVIKTAVEVLSAVMEQNSPAPSVVPMSSGGVQFEWHRGGIDLEIMFSPSGEALFDFENVGGEQIEGNVTEQPERVAELISRLPK